MENITNYIPLGLVLMVVTGLIVLERKVSYISSDKVGENNCEERRKELNADLRIAVDKLDKFKEQQTTEHMAITASLATLLAHQGEMSKKLDKMNGNGK